MGKGGVEERGVDGGLGGDLGEHDSVDRGNKVEDCVGIGMSESRLLPGGEELRVGWGPGLDNDYTLDVRYKVA